LETKEPGDEPYEFKIQLFKADEYEKTQLIEFGSQSFDQEIMERLKDYDAEQPRSQTHKIGSKFDKHRILFTIKAKEKAIQFWQDFVMDKSKRIHECCRHKIYLQMPEEVYIKYSDIEAEKLLKEKE
jgi:hypothetical protein